MNRLLKNIHLILSSIIVIPAAFIYGSPRLLPQILDIQVQSNDMDSMLKAIMMLYLSIAFVWIAGIVQPKYWRRATELNALFMLSLGFGRIMSMIISGWPTEAYAFGTLGELLLGSYALYQLSRHHT